MVRIGRLTDYGVLLMIHMDSDSERAHTASEVASRAQLPLPTVSKLLRALTRAGLLVSHRGVKGGYSLARPAKEISIANIIAALEGPVALTLCTTASRNERDCEYEPSCPVRGRWQRINDVIWQALDSIPLSEMAGRVALRSVLPVMSARGARHQHPAVRGTP